MEFLQALATTPTSTLLVIGGILFLFLSFVTLKKPIVVELNSKSRTSAGIIGGLMLILGVVLSVFTTQQLQITPTPTPEIIPSTLTPTPDIVIVSPTTMPVTSTPESGIPSLFSKNCFHSTTWLVSSGNIEPPAEENGCWQLSTWGWFATDNGFSIYKNKSKDSGLRAIYMPINSNVQVQFDIQINRMYTPSDVAAKTIFGIVDADDTSNGAFLVIKEILDESQAQVQFGDSMIYPTDSGRYFRYRKSNSMRFVLEGVRLSTYLNGQLLSEQGITTSEPVFWIGNRFFTNGDVDLTISNLVISESNQ